ncbi:MAG: phage scaffolding protein [Ruminococcus sp.]|nr:phage scaffolding protein [Ruminococcus sp.]
MKRDFLEGLTNGDGQKILDKATIDSIMTEYGKELNGLKDDHKKAIEALEKERDGFSTQLDDAQKKLKGFDGVDVNELQGKVAQLTQDIEDSKKKYEAEIADIKFANLLDSKITQSGAKNNKAVLALLDIDALKQSKNQEQDILAAITAVKASDDYLFASTNSNPAEGNAPEGQEGQQPLPNFSNGNLQTGNRNESGNTGFDFGFIGVRPHDTK